MKNLPSRLPRPWEFSLSLAGIRYALSGSMELLGRLCTALGISLVLTLLLLVLYQDDGGQAQPDPGTVSQASAAATLSTP